MVAPADQESNNSLPLLDPSRFAQKWRVFALRVPSKLTQGTVVALKEHVMRVPRVALVARPGPGEQERFILLRYFAESPPVVPLALRGNMVADDVGKADSVAQRIASTRLGPKVSDSVVHLLKSVDEASLYQKVVEIGYEHWPMDAVLEQLLPAGTVVPSAFETVGHIAHINLREEHLPFKRLIARVVIDKLKPRIRTVVNKTESTSGPYRTFGMEVLAGDKNLETSLRENGCTFLLDFSKVYWNSRLETEHRRIVDSLDETDVLADAFCGIGPFALPAYRMRKCRVFANDLNPTSVEYLRRNAVKNGITEGRDNGFVTSCGCARDFLKRLVQEQCVPITRVVMNFPSGAPEFLDVFSGLYSGLAAKNMPMPTVNCYCFARGDNWEQDATARVRCSLGLPPGEDLDIHVREVRDVAPKKRQVCVTFRVPESVAYRSRSKLLTASDEAEGPTLKRRKVCGIS